MGPGLPIPALHYAPLGGPPRTAAALVLLARGGDGQAQKKPGSFTGVSNRDTPGTHPYSVLLVL